MLVIDARTASAATTHTACARTKAIQSNFFDGDTAKAASTGVMDRLSDIRCVSRRADRRIGFHLRLICENCERFLVKHTRPYAVALHLVHVGGKREKVIVVTRAKSNRELGF